MIDIIESYRSGVLFKDEILWMICKLAIRGKYVDELERLSEPERREFFSFANGLANGEFMIAVGGVGIMFSQEDVARLRQWLDREEWRRSGRESG